VAARVADVRTLLAAANAVVADRGALVPELQRSTGLSAQGVELALSRHLELEATDAELAALASGVSAATQVAVVLSANVFVGALRAIALAIAAADDVIVRPSRRDPSFAVRLVGEATMRGALGLRLEPSLDVAAVERGEIHVYGSDETIGAIRAKARVPVRGHGNGMGVAWVSARAEVGEAARALAEDVVVFDQRGCLSPRIAIVEGDTERASTFGEALHGALEAQASLIPRGEVPAAEESAAARYIATMTYAGRALVGVAHGIGIAQAGAPLFLPPPYRHVHVAPCATLAEARRLLSPLAAVVVAVGSDDPSGGRQLAPPWARLSSLGAMQRPPLDGPVDRRDSTGASQST
jgi:hypothetical protein